MLEARKLHTETHMVCHQMGSPCSKCDPIPLERLSTVEDENIDTLEKQLNTCPRPEHPKGS